MSPDEKRKIPFKDSVRASKQEVQEYLSKFFEEYRTITSTDLPETCDRFPLWAYPVRLIAGITRAKVYVFITRDGDPVETRVEVFDDTQRRELNQVMDAFTPQLEAVAKIVDVRSAIYAIAKDAKEGEFNDDVARSDATQLIEAHYKILADSKQIEPISYSTEAKMPQYVPPITFMENHIESNELRSKIEHMLKEAKREIMVSGWFDTILLDILQEKSKEGVSIQILTNKPDPTGPKPNRTAYAKIPEIAQVRRNDLWHFRMIICDGREALVSSADLTTHSLSQNYEAGIWTSSPIIVKRAIALFKRVWLHKDTIDVNQEAKIEQEKKTGRR